MPSAELVESLVVWRPGAGIFVVSRREDDRNHWRQEDRVDGKGAQRERPSPELLQPPRAGPVGRGAWGLSLIVWRPGEGIFVVFRREDGKNHWRQEDRVDGKGAQRERSSPELLQPPRAGPVGRGAWGLLRPAGIEKAVVWLLVVA
jgi:hypothetical protein